MVLLSAYPLSYPHLLYIPIILAAFFYPRRGIAFAVFVSLVYFLMVVAVRPITSPDIISAAARCVVYVFIAMIISWLSDRVNTREAALVRAKEEWVNTFNGVTDLIAVIGNDHRILRVNKAMAESLGITPEQAVGKRCYEVVHTSNLPPANCPHEMLLKDGKEHTAEVHEENLGGDFLVTVSPLHDDDGTLIGSVHVARDITEQETGRSRTPPAFRDPPEHGGRCCPCPDQRQKNYLYQHPVQPALRLPGRGTGRPACCHSQCP